MSNHVVAQTLSTHGITTCYCFQLCPSAVSASVSSHAALSTASVTQPHSLSQFLSEPPSAVNPNNPFLPTSTSAWPAENLLALKAPNNAIGAITNPNSRGDLDTRLAEIADQLSVSNTNSATCLNWSGIVKPQQSLPISATSMATTAMNPWMPSGSGVLQPTPVSNSSSLTSQVSKKERLFKTNNFLRLDLVTKL